MTRIGLVIAIISGLLAIGNVFFGKAPTNHTSGDGSHIINTRDGDVDLRIGIQEEQQDSTKSK